jgi:hypothetical protein
MCRPTDKLPDRSYIYRTSRIDVMTTDTLHSVADPASRRPWATASFADTADTTPGELSALEAHVDRCNGLRGRMFRLQCAADAMIAFVAPRFVTTAVIVALVFGVASLIV